MVHIDPGPIPTFITSTPALIRSFAASFVAILPTTSGICLRIFFAFLIKSIVVFVCACATSIKIMSTFDLISS